MKTKKDKTFVFLNTTIKPGVNQVLIRTEPEGQTKSKPDLHMALNQVHSRFKMALI